ncbi:MAG TPA: hypothetical protein PLA98_16765, partial [Alicycliphilus sp.]|nr:hypothetical protein [Alicycliphilus sp.]
MLYFPFSETTPDRNENLKSLVSKAKLMKLEGFESVVWEDPEWQVDAGRLVKLTGKNTKSASFGFSLSPKLGSAPLDGCWELVAKTLFVLRFHRKYQSAPNQRS